MNNIHHHHPVTSFNVPTAPPEVGSGEYSAKCHSCTHWQAYANDEYAQNTRVAWKWLETGDRTIKDRFVGIISCNAALVVTADTADVCASIYRASGGGGDTL
jgi:hypothetical protein